MTTAEFLDADSFIGADTSFNIFTCRVCNVLESEWRDGSQRVFDAADENAALRLETTGEFHLGHYVNAFRQGFSSYFMHSM